LAWDGWWAEKQISSERGDIAIGAGPLLLRGFLSNVFNTKSILFFVSVLPTFIAVGPNAPALAPQMVLFGTLYVSIATLVHGSIVILAAELRPWLVEGPQQLIVRRVLSAVLAFVAIWLGWTAQR
jgi:threonine/homoserine/homoserine lactone efflux protein